MSIEDLYSKKVMQHFLHPKNMGEIKNPDGKATVGNPVCGDIMQVTIKVKSLPRVKSRGKKEKGPSALKLRGVKKTVEILEDVKFKTLGCGAAIATSSMVTEMAKGKRLDEAQEISNQAVAKALGGLPKVKLHCSVLAADVLGKAIKDYYKKLKNKNSSKSGT